MNKILLIGSDGLETDYLDRFKHPFWEKIKKDMSLMKIKCPEDIESGETSVASSPRLWSRYNTGAPCDVNCVQGFWEKLDKETKEPMRVDVGLDWIREHKCEKLVNRNDLGVDPIWTVLLRENRSVGLITVWFSYPLTDEELELLEKTDSWFLTDFPFPKESELIKPERNFYPDWAEPSKDFLDQVGAGARIPIMVHEDPIGLKNKMALQDKHRLDYGYEMLKKQDVDFFGMYLRGVDGMQHILRNQQDAWRKEGGFVPEGKTIDESFANESDLKTVYDYNMDGIQKLWETDRFDTLIVCSDHGSASLSGGSAHSWPGYVIMYGENIPNYPNLEGWYEDLPVTILEMMNVDPPDYMTGSNILAQAEIGEKMRSLGYL